MRKSISSVCACLFVACVGGGARADPLPLVQDVEFRDLHHCCERLLQTLKDFKGQWPEELAKALPAALAGGQKNPEAAVKEIQKLVDAHCLVQVSINPESRVKAARGPARAELPLDRDAIFLVKIHNEAGVTHPLKVSEAGWLELEVYAKPKQKALSGQRLEYVLLRLRAREAGKREATLKFDVGQGTQDLGFRAEVPILFTVLPKNGRT
jgi:hypothetical protein